MTKYQYHVTCDEFRKFGVLNKIDGIVLLRGLYPNLTLKEAKDMISSAYTELRGIKVKVEVTLYCQECDELATFVEHSSGYHKYKCNDHVTSVVALFD